MAAIVSFASHFGRRARGLALGAALLTWAQESSASSTSTVADSPNDELQSLQRAALRQAQLDERSRKSLETRLRLSALLPHLRVNVGRGWQWDTPSSSSTSSTSTPDVNDHLSYGLAAQWDLSRLLFQREELLLRRDAQRLAAWRTQLLLRVARLYGQRCKALAEHATGSADAQQRTAERLLALDVTLAALTGDEHVGRKLHRCPQSATAGLDRELQKVGNEPLAEPPPENLAEEQSTTSGSPDNG